MTEPTTEARDERTPSTEAGRRLLETLGTRYEDVSLRPTILAIEAEARASLDVDALALAFNNVSERIWNTHSTFWPEFAVEYARLSETDR